MNETKFGYLLINKPVGPTSHDIVHKLRCITGIKKIGHAGTLDPFACGILILAIGREATKGINRYVKLNKEYVATLYLGSISTTYDREGEIKKWPGNVKKITNDEVQEVLKKFVGEQLQTPPMFSAKKVKGKRLYKLARQGRVVDRPASAIKIETINLLKYEWPFLQIKIKCSSGTYIRALADDIGKKLNCGAYLSELQRTKIGPYLLENSFDIEKINKENWTNYLFS